MAFTNLEPTGVNTSATFTFANVTVTGNVTSGNANLGNSVTANYFIGNGSLLTGIAGTYSNADVANYLPTYTGNVSANYFIGNGSTLSSLAGANVTGQVANALIAGTVYTNSQPNITSVGTLTSVTVSGTANVSNLLVTNNVLGNLIPNANLTYNLGNDSYRWKDLYLSGNSIFIGDAQISTVGNDISLTGNLSSGNSNLGNLAIANFFSGNGSLLSSLTGGNVTGQVGNALISGTVYTNSQPNITSVGTLSSLSVTGNITSGNSSLGNLATANFFTGDGSLLSSLTGGNVTGQVGNALISGTVYTNSQPNITSVGTLSSLSVTGNASAGNILSDNLLYSNGVAWSFGSTYSNTNVAAYLPTYTGNVTAGNILTNNLLYSNGVAWNFGGTYSNADVANYLPTYTGNVSANYFIGNGATLTNLAGGNVIGQVSNSLIAGTVYTNAQPNITSLGTLSNLSVTSNASAGNILTDNLLYSNGVAWSFGTTYSNTNVAAYLPTYTGNISANYFIGNGALLTNITGGNVTGQVSNALISGTVYTNSQPNITSLGTLSSLTVTGNISSGNANLGNLTISNFYSGNGSLLSSLTGSNVTGQVANALIAGTVYTNAQPNITSLGTLSGLSIVGNINITGNINATGNLNYSNVTDLVVGDPLIYIGANNTGNLYDLGIVASYNDGTYEHTGIARDASDGVWKLFDSVVAEPTTTIDFANGTYASFKSGAIESTGNVTANYFIGNGATLTNITGGNVTGQVGNALIAGTVYTNAQPNITSLGTLSNLTVTANASAGNILTNNLLYSNGVAWNLNGTYSNTNVAAYLPTYTGNVSANYFIGNGSALTNLTGGNVTGQVGNALLAGTVYTNAQPNITSLGTLSSLSVTGTASAGNISATGTIIGTAVTANFNMVTAQTTGVFYPTFVSGNTSGNYALSSDVEFKYDAANNELTVGNIVSGNGSGGTLSGANLISANFIAGTLLANSGSQPNITSVGTLSSLSVTANITAGNSNLGNLTVANFFSGNGSLLTSITGSNVTGQVGNALLAGTVYTNAQPNITSVGTLSNLTVTSNVSAGNILTNNLLYANGVAWSFGTTYSNTNVAAYLPTYTGNVSANYFIGNGATLTNITGGNVTGQVGNALISGTVYTNAQPNITSVGTLSNLTVTSNVSAGNILTNNLLYANGVAWSFGSSYSNTNVAAYLPTYTGNITAGNISATGNITAGNSNLGNLTVANFFSGNGSLLTSLTGSNVTGQVGNALISGTVYTNAQPNITSVGTLASTTLAANANVNMSGTLSQITGANLVSATNLTGTLTTAAQPNITSVGTLSSLTVSGLITATGTGIRTSNIQDSSGTVTVITGYNSKPGDIGVYGNITAGTSGTGNVIATNLTGTLTTGAQPNITSTGTLTSLTVTGNISSGNANLGNAVTANFFIGNGALLTGIATGTPASISNGTSNVNIATSGGNVTVGVGGTANVVTITSSSLITANANVTSNLTLGSGSGGSITGANLVSANFITGTLTTAAQPNITSVGTLGSLTVTANVSAGNILTNNLLYANGVAWSFGGTSYSNTNVAAYLPTYTGTITAGNLTVSGTILTGPITGNGTVSITATRPVNAIGESWFFNSTFTDPDSSVSRAVKISGNGLAVLGGIKTDTLESTGNANIGGNITITGRANVTGNVALSSNLSISGSITSLIRGTSGMNVQGEGVFFTSTFTDPDPGITRALKVSSNGLAVLGGIRTDSLTSNGNITSGNANLGNLVVGNFFSGNGSLLTSLTGGNVSGQVGNALVSSTVYTAAQPNITSVGTLSSLSVTANVSAGNISITNITSSGTITVASTAYTTVALGSVTGSGTINVAAGTFFTATVSGAVGWTFSNPVASPNMSGFVLELTNGGTGTQTWPTNTKWPGGVAPTLTASGVDVLTFITDDGGTTWRGVGSMIDSK